VGGKKKEKGIASLFIFDFPKKYLNLLKQLPSLLQRCHHNQ
jgi:hypothetical protein